jgi:BirA family transcriptional regulator, biotin operon repressor / biotin---[acetyl-CoA-carboxylase] ligase
MRPDSMPTSAASTHLHWDAESLWQTLTPLVPRISVEVLARCESTNTTLLERARRAGGDPDAPVTLPGALESGGAEAADSAFTPHGRRGDDLEPCLLVAEQQTRGRGRLGRGWVSATGASLTFSLAMPLAPRDWSGLSLAVGLALADALDPEGASAAAPAQRVMLKWPNDLWLVPAAEAGTGQGRKLGGVLIETVSVGRRRMCIVGVGLNILPLPAAQTEGLASGYAHLQELQPGVSAPGALASVAAPLVRALQAFAGEGFAPLVERYAKRDLLRGVAVVTTTAAASATGAPLQGVAEGVDALGALVLRTPGGLLQRVVSGEVSVRPVVQPGAAPGAQQGMGPR